MNIDFLVLISKIKSLIAENFPDTLFSVSADDIYGDIIISLKDKEAYYSNKFQELVSCIHIDFLWPQDITNVLFVADEEIVYKPVFSNDLLQRYSVLHDIWITQEATDYSVNLTYHDYCSDPDELKVS